MDSEGEDEDWKERSERFLRKLYAFHERNGSPIRRLPTLGGRELNLYHLYNKVREYNGAEEVTRNRQWGEIVRSFNLPRSVTSASYALRQHYIRFLQKFEAYESDPDYANYIHSSTSSSLLAKATPSAPPPHPLSHSISASHLHIPPPSPSPILPQPVSQLSSTLPTYQRPCVPGEGVSGGGGTECDKVVRSLISGFPNEVDFALNVLTIMSFNKPAALPVAKVPFLLDVMLAHLAVFPEDDFGLEMLFLDCWSKSSEVDFIKFWKRTVPEWVYDVIFSHHNDKDSSYLPSETVMSVYRASQIANILRNLTFEPDHVQFLSQHNATLKFLCLTCNCSVPSVKSLSLDTLINLAPYILLPTDDDSFSIASLLFASVQEWILSSDMLAVLKGLEVLGELAWCFRNEVMIAGTPHTVFQRLFDLLLLPDCFLLLTALNTMYNLTLLSEQLCNGLLAVEKSLSVLLSLLTLRVETFGDTALSKIKLIDTTTKTVTLASSGTPYRTKSAKGGVGGVQVRVVPSASLTQLNTTSVSKQTSGGGGSLVKSNSTSSLVTKPQSALKIGNAVIPTLNFGKKQQDQGGTTLSPLLQSSSNTTNPVVKAILSTSVGPLSLEQLQSLLVKSIPSLPQVSASMLQKSLASITGTQGSPLKQSISTVSMKPAQPVVTNNLKVATVPVQVTATPTKPGTNAQVGVTAEGYAASWLKSGFEESRGSYMTQMEVYSQYIKSCADANQSKMLNLSDFTKCIKTVFPNSLSTRITFANQIVYMIAGLAKKRDTTIPSPSLQSLVASPTSSRTPSPSLPGLTSSSNIAPAPPTVTSTATTTATAVQSSLTVKRLSHSPSPSPSPSLQGDQISSLALNSKLSTASPSPSLSNQVSLPLMKASQDRSISSSPSPFLQTSLPSPRSSTSPTSSAASSTNHVSSNRVLNLSKLRESSISPSPLSRVSLSPAPSTQGSTQSQVKISSTRNSISPTPPPSLPTLSTQNLLTSSGHKRSLSPVSLSSQGSLLNATHPKTTIMSKPRDSESPSPSLDHGSSLASLSSSSLQSNSSLSTTKSQDYLSSRDEFASAIPESKRIKLASTVNGHDNAVGGDVSRNSSRTPSPLSQVFNRERIDLNGQDRDKLESTSIRKTSLSSFQTGLTTVTQPVRQLYTVGIQSVGQTSLGSSTLTGQTGLTTSTKSAFSPAKLPGIALQRTNVLSNGTRISLTDIADVSNSPLNLTASSGPTHKVGGVQSVDNSDVVLIVNGPFCQWRGCTRRCSSHYSLFSHLVYDHLPTLPSYPSECLWRGCSHGSTKRMRPSLMTHLQTHHCNLEPKPGPLNVAKTLQQLRSMTPFQNEDESPLTKAVRLTSALVIRNLARTSPRARVSLRCYESQLCQVALSESEASTAAAQCLHFISASHTSLS